MKAPSTNIQTPEKHQASSSKIATTHDYCLRFGASLDVGASGNPCSSVSICVQVVKTRINKGFLARVDGHCQRNCQFCGGWKHNSPQFFSIPLKLAHYTLTCRGGSVA